MKVAITGASGFLGSHCMAAAVAAGHEVRAVVRNPAKVRAAADLHDLQPDGIDVVVADLTDHEALRASLNGVDALLHAGAFRVPRLADDAVQKGLVELLAWKFSNSARPHDPPVFHGYNVFIGVVLLSEPYCGRPPRLHGTSLRLLGNAVEVPSCRTET